MRELSVIVPVCDEAGTIRHILDKIDKVPIDKEVIVVDDGSSDGTGKILREIKDNNLKIICHSSRRGKGAAVLTGLDNASGEFVVIQDADLEYDPGDYLKLLTPLRENRADLVLGARFTKEYKGLLAHRIGNMFLTALLDMLFGVRFNDCHTCYKVLRRDMFIALNLKAQGFDIDTEIVAKAIRRKLRITEVPVSYYPRNYSQGKKIRWKDGLWAIFYMFKYRFERSRQ